MLAGARRHLRLEHGEHVTRRILLFSLPPPALSLPCQGHKAPRGGRAAETFQRGVCGAWMATAGGAEPQGTRGKALKSGVVGRHATCGERGGQSRVGGRQAAGSGSESRGQEGCEGSLVTLRTLLTVRAAQLGVPVVDDRAGSLTVSGACV